jgi:hypothetical protein
LVQVYIFTYTIIEHMTGNDPQNNYYTQAQTSNCNFSTASIINVGVFYNDVWAYRICNSSGIDQHRYADQACIGRGKKWI